MLGIIKKFDGLSIKDLSPSSKFCSFGAGGCSLEGKFGNLNFDFSEYPQATKCQFKFKRRSGNGLIAVIIGGETTNYNVISKISENILVSIDKSKEVTVIRPMSGIGNIDLVSVSLMTDSDIGRQKFEDLKIELEKCNTVCIRGVGNRFFANDGSKIKYSKRLQVATKPPNMFKQNDKGNIISFAGICEVIYLSTDVEDEPSIDRLPAKTSIVVTELYPGDEFNINEEMTQTNNVIEKIKVASLALKQQAKEIPQQKKPAILSCIKNVSELTSEFRCNKVTSDSIKYADYIIKKYSTEDIINKKISINIDTVSGMRWISKAGSLVNNLKHDPFAKVLLCSIDRVTNTERVFLESFYEDEITEKSLQALAGAKKIFTSTQNGAVVLMDRLNAHDRVEVVPKVWPYVKPRDVAILNNLDFITITNRNDAVTRFVIDVLGDRKIVVLGARGQYSKNITPVNEYLDYDNLVWILDNSKVVIDFHRVEDHISGLSNLTLNLGTNLITNSWHYMVDTNAIFRGGDKEIEGYMVPGKESILDALDNLTNLTKDIEKQRKSFSFFIEKFV